jgi:hypothetical protein
LLAGIISGNHVSMSPEGTEYLLHFEHPYNGPMQHYVGFTASDLDQRLKDHRAGTGAVTTRRPGAEVMDRIFARNSQEAGEMPPDAQLLSWLLDDERPRFRLSAT